MATLIVIPARYASTRYPGKPLVELRGASGKSMSLIERSWRAAKQVEHADRIVVATDDTRIQKKAQSFGAEVIMTSSTCKNGTERCSEVAEQMPEYDVIVNLQGDAPLTPPWFVDALIAQMEDSDVSVATPVLRCDTDALNGFIEDRKNGRVGGTTAVFSRSNNALYFSKEVIPYTDNIFTKKDITPVFHHVGVYAYRPKALTDYMSWEECPLEKLEGLEQLRFMENDTPVKCVEVNAKGREFWELNNPIDVERIEKILAKQGME